MTDTSKLTPVTADNFRSEVIESDKPVVVDFGADWCPPCRALHPVLEEVAEESQAVATVATVDIDANQELAEQYGIHSIPTLLFFRGGTVVDTLTGVVSKAVLTGKIQRLVDDQTPVTVE